MDWVAIEAPLEVWINRKPATVFMRTLGEDEELVRGFLFNEGIIAGADDVIEIGRSLDALVVITLDWDRGRTVEKMKNHVSTQRK
jgi:formate dehydrogenase assembly factor FdhD